MTNPYASLPKHVTICEVGPRDGLQNEAQTVTAADKVRYIEMLVDAGVTVLEATSRSSITRCGIHISFKRFAM